jgi:Uma2 family endonuclease
MSVVTVEHDKPLLPVFGDWTVDDLDTLPNDGLRYELFDGVLVVSPAPVRVHQRVVVRLSALLHSVCPPDLEVLVAPIDFRPTRRRSFQPDVLITWRDDEDDKWLKRLVLAVEVLSPSSRSIDLLLKREKYGQSGVEHYWIVDPDEPSIVAFELRGEAYEQVAAAKGDEVVELTAPYPVRICPADLVDGTTRPDADGTTGPDAAAD